MDTNLINHRVSASEKAIQIRCVDGTVYFITCRNPLDYFLNPEFLRFSVITCVIYALLRGDGDVPGVTGWPFLAIWTMVLTVVLLWLAICGRLMRLLFENGLIRQVWTPLVLLPLNFLIEGSVQGMMFWLVDQPLKPMGTMISDLARDLTILLLLDILHGHYVVARHPYARLSEPFAAGKDYHDSPGLSQEAVMSSLHPRSDPPEVAGFQPDPGGKPRAAVNPTVPLSVAAKGDTVATSQKTTVRIGLQTFSLSDILVIRIEEHYLSITTRFGKSTQRAKLGAIDALHNGELGTQIHRSVWVAFWAIREVHPAKNGQILLILSNGDEELVAKSRVYAFRQAYRVAKGGLA